MSRSETWNILLGQEAMKCSRADGTHQKDTEVARRDIIGPNPDIFVVNINNGSKRIFMG